MNTLFVFCAAKFQIHLGLQASASKPLSQFPCFGKKYLNLYSHTKDYFYIDTLSTEQSLHTAVIILPFHLNILLPSAQYHISYISIPEPFCRLRIHHIIDTRFCLSLCVVYAVLSHIHLTFSDASFFLLFPVLPFRKLLSSVPLMCDTNHK